MKLHRSHWFAAILLGSVLALPSAFLAAEKSDMMKDDKGKMMKDTVKDQKSKTKTSAGKMQMDKMDEMKK